MISYFKKINQVLTPKDKRLVFLLLILSVFLSLIETIGISAIMPFISVLSTPGIIETNKYLARIYSFFGFKSELNFIISMGFFLIGLYLFRALYNIGYIYFVNYFTFRKARVFSKQLFYNYINLPYKEFIMKDPSAMTKAVITDTTFSAMLILYALFLIGECLTTLFLYLALLYVNWKITLILSVILILKMAFFSKMTSGIVRRSGARSNEYNNKFFKIVTESFRNLKIIKLTSNERKLADEVDRTCSAISNANVMNQTLTAVPRYAVEAIGFSLLMAVIIYLLYQHKTALSVLPLITMYALALYRMLPSFNRILVNYNQILFTSKSFDIIHEGLLYKPSPEMDEKINFEKSIQLKNISFSYDGKKKIMDNLDLEIRKGAKIAITGESGIGKSTLVDLIIGLHKPHEGRITIDGMVLSDSNIKDWRRKIGYLPQSVYLFDSTVAENVTMGREYNRDKIIEVLQQARIYNFLTQRNGIDTRVGEEGIKFSVGQKQRIGIARALYGNPEIIVLDEATSALDSQTEKEITEEIYRIAIEKTLVMIAHRKNIIHGCETVYELSNGSLEKVTG